MPDREKALKGLECLITNEVPCEGCPYNGSGYCMKNIAKDARELLKEQQEERERIVEDAPTVNGWISVNDRLPDESPSIFGRFVGTDRWTTAMWEFDSMYVIVCVKFPDGTSTVTTGQTHDGTWVTKISPTLKPTVTHWMPMPDKPEDVTEDA